MKPRDRPAFSGLYTRALNLCTEDFGLGTDFGAFVSGRKNRLPGNREPQHFLYFLPLPHGHGSFRLIFLSVDDFAANPDGGIVGGCAPDRNDIPPTNIDAGCSGFFP
jgi:hypothetical protein